MPAIVQTEVLFSATITETTLTGTGDTFVYNQNTKQTLALRNPTGSTITPTLVADATSTAVTVPGYRTVNATLGYGPLSVVAGATRYYKLDTFPLYLQGPCSITSGAGLVASITRG
jgi:hypothetical protein